MADPRLDNFSKYDILVEVKTLCRKAKTTTWAELIETWFKTGDAKWNPEDYELKTSGVGHARMGLMTSYMTDVNRHLDPTFGKAILPEMDGVANGLGQIVLVGYKEGDATPNPLITVLFEFSQKPGEEIKVSKNMLAYEERRKELEAIEKRSLLIIRDLYAGLDSYIKEHKGYPRVTFTDDEKVPEALRGRRFTPCLTRAIREKDHSRVVVVHIQEWTTEPDDVFPPYLFSLYAEEADDGELSVTYEGNGDLTDEQDQVIKEVVFALRDVIYGTTEGSPHTLDMVGH